MIKEMSKKKSVVLVVADNDELLGLLHRFLSSQNYEVRCTSHVLDALVKLDTSVDICIIADYKAPGLNGFDFSKMAKSKKNIPMIGITGFEDVNMNSLLAHFDHILFKPFRLNTLAKSIDSLIKKAKCHLN